ncbi:MAG: 4-hydroxythreonine-4-phosphate dehydrogenase PdxA, partial [Bacteroidota bacterium]
MKNNNILVGITQGDMNSISYEVILKTLKEKDLLELCTPILYGSPKAVAYHRKALDMQEINLTRINDAGDANTKKANIINCLPDNLRIELGKSTAAAGEGSYKALEAAINDLLNKKIDVVVTGPINKHNIQSKDFNFPGHTEYLKNKANASEVLMLMVNKHLRIGVVAGHVPIKDVASYVTPENIKKKTTLMHHSLQYDFNIRKPKIAILGLNPHCGDEGVIGNEEQEVIKPAIEALRNNNIMAFGPYAADGFFGSEAYKEFDGVLAMYHDQGLAPFKALDNESGVNFTAGLPIIRTSPAHGTAYELAGLNQAQPDSFRESI